VLVEVKRRLQIVDRVGGSLTAPVLSHHRTCFIAYGGSD